MCANHRKWRGGPKRFSKTPPKASQLTQSEFLSAVYDIQDELENVTADTMADLQATLEDIADRIRTLGEEQQEKKDNMPEGLQEGEAGQLLEERASECEQAEKDRVAELRDEITTSYSGS